MWGPHNNMKGSDESSDKHEEKIVPEISCPAVKAGSGWVQCLITYHQTAFLLKCFTAGWSTPGAPSLRGQRMTRRWLSRCGNWLIFSSLSLTFLDVNKNLNPGKGSHHRIPATKVSSLFLPCSGPKQWPRHITRRLWRWVHYWIKQQIHFDLQAWIPACVTTWPGAWTAPSTSPSERSMTTSYHTSSSPVSSLSRWQ